LNRSIEMKPVTGDQTTNWAVSCKSWVARKRP
jgi:hypothetical protein